MDSSSNIVIKEQQFDNDYENDGEGKMMLKAVYVKYLDIFTYYIWM